MADEEQRFNDLGRFLAQHAGDEEQVLAQERANRLQQQREAMQDKARKQAAKGDFATRPGMTDEAARPGGGGDTAARPGGGNGLGTRPGGEGSDEAGARIAQQSVAMTPELVDSGEFNMLEMLAEQQGMKYVELGRVHIPEDVVKLFPPEFARDNKCLPIEERDDGTLVVAISDPLNVTIADNLRLLLERDIEPVVSKEDDILDLIDRHFSHAEDIEELMDELHSDAGIAGANPTAREFELDADPVKAAASPPVIRLVNLILLRALKDRASDLHIEPFATTIRVRYRVDGVLRELPPPPKSFQVGLITRFKVMADMNITEARRPQDGRIKLTTQGREVDLRVSCLPTIHGESIVIRVLDKQMMMIGLDQIGMTKKVRTVFKEITRRPNGVVLVTGPTGSGKTTSLYAAVTDRLNPDEKFITTEDPVEYEVPGLVQVNINSKVGLTFAACLRAILRQDPDVLLVGEIRDVETAKISVEAALTGHLVFSTLHTNSASATVTRLVDMGIEPFLLTSTLQVVIGQRLVRSICPTCREPYTPTDDELREFGCKSEDVRQITFYHGAGCDECNFQGFRGRLGLFEMLVITDEIRDLMLERATADELQEQAMNDGMLSMRQDGFLKICMGVTTFSEVSHHVMTEDEEAVRREIQPILKQLREKLGGEEKDKLPQSSGKTELPPPVDPSAGLPDTSSLPGSPDSGGDPDAAAPIAAEGGGGGTDLSDLPDLPPLSSLGLADFDDSAEAGGGVSLGTSDLEEQTPLSDMEEMGSFNDLPSLEELGDFGAEGDNIDLGLKTDEEKTDS